MKWQSQNEVKEFAEMGILILRAQIALLVPFVKRKKNQKVDSCPDLVPLQGERFKMLALQR